MAWLIGIDEAGYGPNLGPMVQSAVAISVPDPKVDLWQTLRSVARRASDKADGRIAIDDSKAVHQGPNGFVRLEESAHAIFPIAKLHDWLAANAVLDSADDLTGESWYDADATLPLGESHQAMADDWKAETERHGIEFEPPRVIITPTPRFNEVVAEHGTKAAVTGRGIIALIAASCERADDEPIYFTIDKLGGRNFYAAMIQTALPDGWVIPIRESSDLSEYRVEGLRAPIHIAVRPRAEADQMAVAVASILSKYLREVMMRQFNKYWLSHVPGLTPTAGYPVDANRFFAAIRPACAKLGMAESAVWRSR